MFPPPTVVDLEKNGVPAAPSEITLAIGSNNSSASTLVQASRADLLPPSGSKEELWPKLDEEEDLPLPDKQGTKVSRYLNYNFFTTYRKIFTVIFFANLTTFITLIAKARGTPTASSVGNAASANLMVCILFRQENFVNFVYNIFVSAPHSLPLSIRRRLAKVFHYGGAHSGAGVAAVVWYLLYTAIATKEFIDNPTSDATASLVTSYILISMFCFILTAAHPRFRVKFHDYFERMHRFAGWTSLVTFWVQTMLSSIAYAKRESVTLGKILINSPSFWFLCISTFCIFLSWSRLRLRDVYPEVLSDHVIRLHFKYRAIGPFYGLKFSTQPLLEWHAFATIPDAGPDGKINGFSVVVSNAGDWTRRTIQDPPKKLWVRGCPLHDLLYTSKLFKRIVIVATGSGIGPFLSLLFADITPRRILWSTSNPEMTYGDKIMQAVRKADPQAIVWNTRSQGRPDMVALTYQLVAESNAEAVFIISNPKVTKKVVYGMETRGIPAYGAIFDS